MTRALVVADDVSRKRFEPRLSIGERIAARLGSPVEIADRARGRPGVALRSARARCSVWSASAAAASRRSAAC